LAPRARQSGPKSPPLMTSLTKNPHLPSKKFFFECRLEDLPHLLTLRPGRNPNRSRDILTQSHVRLGVFFSKIPEKQPEAKELIG